MRLLDGKALAANIELEIKQEVALLSSQGLAVGLAVVLVGNDPASHAYVKMKAKACERAGIHSFTHEMLDTTTESELLGLIQTLNQDPRVDGILVQLPLPRTIDTAKILESIDPAKDVDGFHPQNIGRLSANLECFAPATPLGVMRLLHHYGIETHGKNAVVVGASNIVGKPMAALLLNAQATPTICHIHTRDLASFTRRAEILCTGVGKPGLITAEMVQEGAVVVDIGISRLADGSLTGDIAFASVAPKCAYITPVPGGVGPMTISSLLENTLKAAKIRRKTLPT